MTVPKRLTLFVEGPGDIEAAPSLVTRLLADLGLSDCLYLGSPFAAGDLWKLHLGKKPRLQDYLQSAAKQRDLGCVLLLLDGDCRLPPGKTFCPGLFASELAAKAREVRGGEVYSFATVFAMKEYECWLLAGIEALAGKPLQPGNRPGVREGVSSPGGNLEQVRDAKHALGQLMVGRTYKPTSHQGPLTSHLVQDLASLRARGMRSFRRLETCLRLLGEAIRSGRHIAIP